MGIIREKLVRPCSKLGSKCQRKEGVKGWGKGWTGEKNNAHFMALYFCTQPQHNSPNVYHSENVMNRSCREGQNKCFMSNTYSNKFYVFEVTEGNVWCVYLTYIWNNSKCFKHAYLSCHAENKRHHWSQLNGTEERLFLSLLCTKKVRFLCPCHKTT